MNEKFSKWSQKGKFNNKRKFERKPKIKKWEKEDAQIKQISALYDLELDAGALFADFPLSAQTHRGIRRLLPGSERRRF